MPNFDDVDTFLKPQRPRPRSQNDFGDVDEFIKPKPSGGVPIRRATPAEIDANRRGAFSGFLTDTAGAFQKGAVEPLIDIYNRPMETLERVGRGALEFAAAFDPGGNAYQPTVGSQAQRVGELEQRAEAQRPESIRSTGRAIESEQAAPRTTAGRVGGFAGSVLGGIAAPLEPRGLVANAVIAPVGGAALQGVGQAARRGISRIRGATAKPPAPVSPREVPRPAASASVSPNTAIPQTFADVDAILGGQASPSRVAGRGRLIDDPVRPPSNPASTRVADPLLFDPEEAGGFYDVAPVTSGFRVSGASTAEMRAPADAIDVATASRGRTALAAGGSKPPDALDVPTGFGGKRPQRQESLFDFTKKSPWQDTALAYFRANLLTNPAGRALDLGSTVVNQVSDAAMRPIAAAVDRIVGKLTAQRSISGVSPRATAKAFGSIPQGLRDAKQVLKTGRQTIDSGADDVLYGREIRSGLGKAVDVPINGVFRVLGALDAPFRRFSFTRNIEDRARVAAMNEAKRGLIPRNQVKARAGQLVGDDSVIAAAVRDGERSVLSEPNKLSSLLAKATRSSPNARLAIGLVQPFVRIPLNAVLKGADFAGIGGIKAMYKIARGGVRKGKGESFFRDIEDQRVFSQNVAAGSFGVAGFLLGMELEDQGELEGYYYTSKKDFPNKRTPTSVKIGGESYGINRLGGFIAAPLFIGATYNRLRKQGSSEANALLRSFSGLIQQAPALGYYGAPAKVGRVLTAEEPGDELLKEAGSITSGFIPAVGAVGAAAKAMDGGKKRKTEGFVEPIMERIPGLRQQLPEKPQPKRQNKPRGLSPRQSVLPNKR